MQSIMHMIRLTDNWFRCGLRSRPIGAASGAQAAHPADHMTRHALPGRKSGGKSGPGGGCPREIAVRPVWAAPRIRHRPKTILQLWL